MEVPSCCGAVATGNLVKVEGRMDSTQFHQTLENNVEESVTKLKLHRGWIVKQDKDPKSVQPFMQGNKYNALEWPSKYPNLDITENLWDDLKHAVNAQQLNGPKYFNLESRHSLEAIGSI